MHLISPKRANFDSLLLVGIALSYMLWPKYLNFSLPGARLNPFYFLVLASLAIWSFRFMLTWRVRASRMTGWAIGLMAAYWLLRYTSDIAGQSPDASVNASRSALLYGGSVFFISVALAGSEKAPRRIALALCASVLVLMLFALIERLNGLSLASILTSTLPLDIEDSILRGLLLDKTRGGEFRSAASFTHPIVYGIICAGVLPLALWTCLSGGRKLLGSFAILACLVGAVWSGSRSAQVAAIAGVLSYFGMLTFVDRKGWLRIAALVSVPIGISAAFPLLDYINGLVVGTGETASSTRIRDVQWQNAWPWIEQNPFVGYGTGRSVQLAGVFSPRTESWTVDDTYLSLWVDSGLISLALLGLLMVLAFIRTISVETRTTEKFPAGLAASFFSAVVAVSVGQKIVSIPEALTLAYLLLGVLFASISVRTYMGQVVSEGDLSQSPSHRGWGAGYISAMP
jgi:hypothetical protein